MSVSPTVLVACDDVVLLDEVIRHLEEIPHWRLVMSARTAGELVASSHRPDCVLISDGVAVQLADHPGSTRIKSRLVAFGRQETTPALRAALKLGARGFVEWPADKQLLRSLVESDPVAPSDAVAAPAGVLHAVWSPKGGAGATVIAAHLAGALARTGRNAILVDLDLDHADQTCVLGMEPGGKTVGDLLRVARELTVQTTQSVLWSHPLGFKVAPAPGSPGSNAAASAEDVGRVLRTIRGMGEHVVADLPSGAGEFSRAVMQEATSVHVVVTPDLLGLRRARDLVADLKSGGLDSSRLHVVLNQAGGTEISVREVEAVLGAGHATRIRADYRIYRAANRGELSPLGCKVLTPLARSLAAPAGAGSAPVGPVDNKRVGARSTAAPGRSGELRPAVPVADQGEPGRDRARRSRPVVRSRG